MLPLTGSFWKRRRWSKTGPPEALLASWHSNPSIGADGVSIPPQHRNQRRNAVSNATQQPIQLQQHDGEQAGDEHHADEARMRVRRESVATLAVGELGVGLQGEKRCHTQLQFWPPHPSQQASLHLKVPAAAPHNQRERTSSNAAEERQLRHSAMLSASRSPSRKPSAAVSRLSVKHEEPEREEEATADSRRNLNTHVIVVEVTPASAPSAHPDSTPTAVSRRGSLTPSAAHHVRSPEATVSTGCQTEHPNAVMPAYRTVLVMDSGCQTVLDGCNMPYVELSEILRSQGGGSTLQTNVNPADVYSIPCAEDLPRCAYSFPSYPLVERLHTTAFLSKRAESSESKSSEAERSLDESGGRGSDVRLVAGAAGSAGGTSRSTAEPFEARALRKSSAELKRKSQLMGEQSPILEEPESPAHMLFGGDVDGDGEQTHLQLEPEPELQAAPMRRSEHTLGDQHHAAAERPQSLQSTAPESEAGGIVMKHSRTRSSSERHPSQIEDEQRHRSDESQAGEHLKVPSKSSLHADSLLSRANSCASKSESRKLQRDCEDRLSSIQTSLEALHPSSIARRRQDSLEGPVLVYVDGRLRDGYVHEVDIPAVGGEGDAAASAGASSVQRECCCVPRCLEGYERTRTLRMAVLALTAYFVLALFCLLCAVIVQRVERAAEGQARLARERAITKLEDAVRNRCFSTPANMAAFHVLMSGLQDPIRDLLTYGWLEYRDVWSFDHSLVFVFTTVSSIGYGHISPRTLEGQVLTMVITVFGLPLMVISVGSMGRFAAHLALQTVASAIRTIRAVRRWCRDRAAAARRAARARRPPRGGSPAGPLGSSGLGPETSRRQRTGTGTTVGDRSFSDEADVYGDRRGVGGSGPVAVDSDFEPDRPGSPPVSESGDGTAKGRGPVRPFKWEADEAIEWAPSCSQMLITALAFCTLLVFVAALFVPVEKWDLFQACYFMFITYATIGFGDITPKQSTYYLCLSVLLVAGLGLYSLMAAMLMSKYRALAIYMLRWVRTVAGRDRPEGAGTGRRLLVGKRADEEDAGEDEGAFAKARRSVSACLCGCLLDAVIHCEAEIGIDNNPHAADQEHLDHERAEALERRAAAVAAAASLETQEEEGTLNEPERDGIRDTDADDEGDASPEPMRGTKTDQPLLDSDWD